MQHPPRTTRRTGSIAAIVTFAVHGLFAVLLLREGDQTRTDSGATQTLEGTWIHLLPLPEPQPVDRAEEPAVADPPARLAEVRPATAITLSPAPAASPPATVDSGPPATSGDGIESRPWTDWDLEAEKLAARREREMAPEGFSGPLQALREPCKPYQSSLFPQKKVQEVPPPSWEDAANPPPGSVMMGGTRVGVVPLVGIPIGGGKEEPNKHLFDDMMAGRTPRSSVPDPNVCD